MLTFAQFLEEELLSEQAYLKPAVKHNGKIYTGDPGSWHDKIIEDNDLPEHAEKGFETHKTRFMPRDQALGYAHKHGLIPHHQNWITSDDITDHW